MAVLSGLESRSGRSRAWTRSFPSARTARAATQAESMPPETATTSPRRRSRVSTVTCFSSSASRPALASRSSDSTSFEKRVMSSSPWSARSGPCPELRLERLARCVARDGLQGHHPVRHLHLRQPLAAEAADLHLGRLPALAQDHEGHRHLALQRILHARPPPPRRAPGARAAPARSPTGLTRWPPILSISLARPTSQKKPSASRLRQVAGPEPAVVEDGGRVLGRVDVAGGDVLAARHQVAHLADRQRPAALVHHAAARPRGWRCRWSRSSPRRARAGRRRAARWPRSGRTSRRAGAGAKASRAQRMVSGPHRPARPASGSAATGTRPPRGSPLGG